MANNDSMANILWYNGPNLMKVLPCCPVDASWLAHQNDQQTANQISAVNICIFFFFNMF